MMLADEDLRSRPSVVATRRAATSLRAAVLSLLLGIAACATPSLPPPPVHASGQVLWRIVHDRCVPGQRLRDDPAPCALVSPGDGDGGFALLKDRVGETQFLLIPTARITGIEDPAVLRPDATNYFAEAWSARGLVEERLGHAAGARRMSVAVNSIYGRSQDQLHLHIDCLDSAVAFALRDLGDASRTGWSRRPILLKGHGYRWRWLAADGLRTQNPFGLLAGEAPGARNAMGAWTLALVSATARDGSAGFLLLAGRADPAAGDKGSAEELQDHDCR